MLRKASRLFMKEICPYCFEYFYLKNTPFRCTSPASQCAPEKDKIYEKFWADSRPLGKVLKTESKLIANSIRCESCNHDSRKRLCPSCHMELPYTMGRYKNYIFAVIGAKESGKSHYISVLINQIRKKLGPQMKMLLEPMNDETMNRYRKDFYDPVFEQGKTINVTKSAIADRSVGKPLVYSLIFSSTNILGGEKIKKAIILVFFDTAGEDLNDEDTMSTVNKYIYRSDGVILLVDPLQLVSVRKKINNTTILPTRNTETADILTRTTRLIKKGRKLKPTDKIKTPIAISFSKFDAVFPLIDSQFQLHASANHQQGFDIEDFEAINGEMMGLLNQWDALNIIQIAETHYKKFGFFGLSALGCNPHGTNKIDSVLPRRVEDPFLWLLFQNRVLKKVKHS